MNSIQIAKGKGVKTLAFPLISAGVYGYPKNDAIAVAISAIKDGLKEYDCKIYLVLFDK